MQDKDPNLMYGTTILSVRKGNEVVLAGDGQVTLGHVQMKSNAKKVRTMAGGSVVVGFAGATADARRGQLAGASLPGGGRRADLHPAGEGRLGHGS